jgi:hypothetical protein
MGDSERTAALTDCAERLTLMGRYQAATKHQSVHTRCGMWPDRAVGSVLILLGLLCAACGGPSPHASGVSYATTRFTCCTRADVEQVWRPGETLTVHWIAQDGARTADAAPHAVRLTVTLTGPYADAASLKRAAAAARRLEAAAITVDDRTATAPISAIALPADLPPGLYDLAFEVDLGGGNRMGGASVVRVDGP